MNVIFDHLVIAADNLPQGRQWLSEKLGVFIPEGGEHPKMGTHNLLMRIGQQSFLEIIAINPLGPKPDRPRWFALDDPVIRASVRMQPRLLTWAVNTSDINTLLRDCSFDFGDIEAMSRGELHWHITVRKDGSLSAGGLLPAILQWHCDIHPAVDMQDLSCTMESLEAYCSAPSWLEQRLKEINADGLIKVKEEGDDRFTGLKALIQSPKGLVEIGC